MIKYVIHSKKWRDKLNGNTYHSVRILNTQNNALIAAPYQYGYGDQFMQSAHEVMSKTGWVGNKFTPDDYLQTHIVIENNCKKSEVLKWGNAN
jgi:hypothetical protein